MLSCLSSYLILFVDRFFLMHYSLDALNAVTASSNLCWGFLGGASMMAGMAELFVAQYNGAGFQQRIGGAVWQMVWFSASTSLVFIPLGIWGPFLFYPNAPLEALYFRWMMCFGALQPLSYALITFFVGRGRVRWMVLLTLSAILLNALLNPLFIPKWGVKGTALANCLTLSFQVVVLFAFFLRKRYKKAYGTDQWRFHFKPFWKACRITVPPAILYNVELLGWSVFYSLMTHAGHAHITISSLCQNLILLFSFFGDGLSRGASILANHYVGVGKYDLIKSILRSSLVILVALFTLEALAFAARPALFFTCFMPTEADIGALMADLQTCFWMVLLHLFFQNVQWLLASLLYSKGASLFAMLAGAASMWLCLILPCYLLVMKGRLTTPWAWALVALYSTACSAAYYWRLRSSTSLPAFQALAPNTRDRL
jgi:MATE family multidrug resistance protein